jgi:hypothetical protein
MTGAFKPGSTYSRKQSIKDIEEEQKGGPPPIENTA